MGFKPGFLYLELADSEFRSPVLDMMENKLEMLT
jgi:hypothetical protein